MPAATLTGVFSSDLEDAQRTGLTLFWAHGLLTVTDRIERTRN